MDGREDEEEEEWVEWDAEDEEESILDTVSFVRWAEGFGDGVLSREYEDNLFKACKNYLAR